MLPQPRISIVVPAYNHERFVGEALDSASRQTVAPLEIVVVDDGSNDATAAVAEQRGQSDPRIRVVRQRNRGSHAAINRGIAESAGDWIAILNSDDRFAPDRLERLIGFCGDRFDFAVSDVRLIDALGAPLDDPAHWWNAKVNDFRARAREMGPVEGLLYGNYTVSTSNFFLRRALYDAIGPLRHFRHIVDWDYALRAALHAPQRFGYLADEVLLDYRLHGGNAILSDTIRGALEIAHMQRRRLRHFGVPAPVVRSLFLAQRDVRRSARDRAVRVVEGYVRERQADIDRHVAELGELQARLATLHADLNAERDRTGDLQRHLAQRDAQLAQRDAQLVERDARLTEREAQLSARDELLHHLQLLLRDRDEKLERFRNSLPGRAYTMFKRLGGR
jgi:glycosyltransferase involved in cell wall biosynthesis